MLSAEKGTMRNNKLVQIVIWVLVVLVVVGLILPVVLSTFGLF